MRVDWNVGFKAGLKWSIEWKQAEADPGGSWGCMLECPHPVLTNEARA